LDVLNKKTGGGNPHHRQVFVEPRSGGKKEAKTAATREIRGGGVLFSKIFVGKTAASAQGTGGIKKKGGKRDVGGAHGKKYFLRKNKRKPKASGWGRLGKKIAYNGRMTTTSRKQTRGG